MGYFVFATVYTLGKKSLKRLMKFTTVWFLRNEIATVYSYFLTAAVNKVVILFSYIYENRTFNSKETCFLGNQARLMNRNIIQTQNLVKFSCYFSNKNLTLYT